MKHEEGRSALGRRVTRRATRRRTWDATWTSAAIAGVFLLLSLAIIELFARYMQ